MSTLFDHDVECCLTYKPAGAGRAFLLGLRLSLFWGFRRMRRSHFGWFSSNSRLVIRLAISFSRSGSNRTYPPHRLPACRSTGPRHVTYHCDYRFPVLSTHSTGFSSPPRRALQARAQGSSPQRGKTEDHGGSMLDLRTQLIANTSRIVRKLCRRRECMLGRHRATEARG